MRQRRQPAPSQYPTPPLGVSAKAVPLELLQRARNTEGEARLELAGRLNAVLRVRPPDENREGWAQFLLERLDDEGFHDLYDTEGVSCRATAVDAVLALGFPYALHITPADLEYLRAVRPGRGRARRWQAMAVVTGVLAALFALAFFIHLP